MRRLLKAMVLASLAAATGCAFTSRAMLMKEYRPSAPRGLAHGLVGKRVYVAPFIDANTMDEAVRDATPASTLPDGVFVPLTGDEAARWDRERDAIVDRTSEENWYEVGWLRNGFGMHTADVFSVNPPTEWLRQSLELELRAQGAKVVGPDEAQDADMRIGGTIRYLKVDIYMKNWADIVVDFELTAKGRATTQKTIHAAGGQTAWTSSGFEFYRALRRCQQQLVRDLLVAVEREVSREDDSRAR